MKLTTITLTAATLIVGTSLVGCATAPATAEPSTPQACIDALDKADELHTQFGDALDISSDAIGHAASFDSYALEQDTARIEDMTPDVQANRLAYDTAAAECRAGQ